MIYFGWGAAAAAAAPWQPCLLIWPSPPHDIFWVRVHHTLGVEVPCTLLLARCSMAIPSKPAAPIRPCLVFINHHTPLPPPCLGRPLSYYSNISSGCVVVSFLLLLQWWWSKQHQYLRVACCHNNNIFSKAICSRLVDHIPMKDY